MKFEITFEISPSGAFGLPELQKTILPSKPGKYYGDEFHTKTFVRTGYGSLPKYRKEEEAINLSLDFGDTKGSIRDNFIKIILDSDNSSNAYEIATNTLDKFLQHLAVSQKRVFTAKPLIIESENGKIYQVPQYLTISSVTIYDLERLSKDIKECQSLCFLDDERLNKALKYFEHAKILYEKRNEIADPLSRHHRYLISSIFLNLWKSVSTIIGDPSRRKDGYQKRYREIGFDINYKSKIDRLKDLRDDYDVAHYNLSEESIDEVEKSFGEAENITAEILNQYRKHLTQNK